MLARPTRTNVLSAILRDSTVWIQRLRESITQERLANVLIVQRQAGE